MDVREKQLSEKRLEEMSEYIKKDELLKFKADVYDEDGHILYAVPAGYIVAMPPDDVMQVRHGRWKDNKCTACGEEAFCYGERPYHLRTDFCPMCGAKMDGGDD